MTDSPSNMIKKCSKCLLDKDENCFFRKSKKENNLESACKECRKKRTLLHRINFPEIWKEKNRRRYLKRKHNPEYVKKTKEYISKNKSTIYAYQKSWALKNKEKRSLVMKKWESNNSHKKKAHVEVRKAIKNGLLIRMDCFCGKKAHAHHEDYSKPLDVVWLCAFHHKQVHSKK